MKVLRGRNYSDPKTARDQIQIHNFFEGNRIILGVLLHSIKSHVKQPREYEFQLEFFFFFFYVLWVFLYMFLSIFSFLQSQRWAVFNDHVGEEGQATYLQTPPLPAITAGCRSYHGSCPQPSNSGQEGQTGPGTRQPFYFRLSVPQYRKCFLVWLHYRFYLTEQTSCSDSQYQSGQEAL